MNPSDYDGPQRECVVHGDGDTFVAEHQRLQAIEARAIALRDDTRPKGERLPGPAHRLMCRILDGPDL
jgi:hypothetical protein